MAEERVEYVVKLDSSYKQQIAKPLTMSDFFKFKVNVVHRDFSTIPGTTIPTPVFRTSIRINCNEFFIQNQNFLWLNLQGFNLSSYFNYEDLALITRSLITRVKEELGLSDSSQLAKPNAGDRAVDIPLFLNIISKVQQNVERIVQEVVEEPRQSERVEYVVRLDSNYKQQIVKPHTLSDFFKIKVTAVHQDFSTIPGTMIPTPLFRTSIRINCNEFFTQNKDFLWLNLQGFYLSPYFNSEDLALITRSLIPRVKEMLGFSDSSQLAKPNAGNHAVDIPLFLTIISKVQMEEPRNCCICIERLHDDLEEDGESDEVKVSAMPCAHVFHHNCLEKWLRTSRVCPLCRYAMPI